MWGKKHSMKTKEKIALALAIKALYFDDNSDYETYLWNIVEALGGDKAVDMLENDSELAYQTYCAKDIL